MAVAPESILRELSGLWVTLGKGSEAEGSTGVLRACAMTLIVIADEADDPGDIGETLASLMPRHPSRAVVIRVQPGAARSLSSRVFAQCWTPFGQRRHICCERIEIMASDASLPDLPTLLLPLVAPDLPVILWCRSPRLFGQLSGIPSRVIVDSDRAPDPVGMLRQIAASTAPVSDLAWTWITRWRELIAQIFHNQTCLARLPRVEQVRVRYTGDRPPAAAWYMAAWLLDGLAQAGGKAQLRMIPAAPGEVGRIRKLELIAPDMQVFISRMEDQAVEIRVDGVVSRTALPLPGDCLLLHEELSVSGRDPIFEKTLAAALALALSS